MIWIGSLIVIVSVILMAICFRQFHQRRARGFQGAWTEAVQALDKAIVYARESHRQLSLVKEGVVAPLRERDHALATVNTLVNARALLIKLLPESVSAS